MQMTMLLFGVASALMAATSIPPEYPKEALDNCIEGEVRMRLVVDDSGRVENVEVLEAIPAGYFEKSAVKAIKRWQFDLEKTPANVPFEYTIEYSFGDPCEVADPNEPLERSRGAAS